MAAQDLTTPTVSPAAEEEAARALAERYGLEYVDVASFALDDSSVAQRVEYTVTGNFNLPTGVS